MEQTPGKIYSALAKFAKECKGIVKDSTNPHFKSAYASLSAIQEGIKAPLASAGLVLVHSVQVDAVTTTVYAEDGSSVSSTFPFTVGKPQENGSAVTYAKRYNTAALLNLDTDADDDGNEAQKTEKPAPAAAKPVTKPATTTTAQPWFNHYFKDTKNETPEWKQLRTDMEMGKLPSAEDYIMEIKKTKKIYGPVEDEIRSLFASTSVPF